MTPLPVCRAGDLEAAPWTPRWLIQDLWSLGAVGIVGGEPKCCKSFLALEMAVAVASGAPCLRRFPVPHPGRVLLYCAEDALHIVRARLEGLCLASGLSLGTLDLHVITAPSLRLDLCADQQRLVDTLLALRPTLLVLDPFVRLHRIDENSSGEVAPLLAYLRELQRRFQLSLVLVHHSKKGGSHLRAGQALRGSSEFHAWGDSNLYLRRSDQTLTLTSEHRAAPSGPGLTLTLHADGPRVALQLLETPPPPASPPQNPTASAAAKIEQALAQSQTPLALTQLRQACRMRTSALCSSLAALQRAGRVHKTPAGYQLTL
jgi:hypothetical protein